MRPSTSRSSRSGVGGTWDATNIVDGAGRGRHERQRRPRRVPRADPAPRSRARRPGSCEPGATLVLGETDPELVAIFAARRPGRVVLRDRDFAVRASGSRTAAAPRPRHADADRTTTCSSRCTARTRPTTRSIALTAAESFLGERIAPDVVARGVRRRSRRPAGSRSSATSRSLLLDGAHNVAGAHALVARARRGVRRGAAHARRRAAPREGAARDARGARRAAIGARASCAPARRARARSTRGGRERGARSRRRPTSGSTSSTRSPRRSPGRSRSRRPTGRSSSPARSTPSVRPAPSWSRRLSPSPVRPATCRLEQRHPAPPARPAERGSSGRTEVRERHHD